MHVLHFTDLPAFLMAFVWLNPISDFRRATPQHSIVATPATAGATKQAVKQPDMSYNNLSECNTCAKWVREVKCNQGLTLPFQTHFQQLRFSERCFAWMCCQEKKLALYTNIMYISLTFILSFK